MQCAVSVDDECSLALSEPKCFDASYMYVSVRTCLGFRHSDVGSENLDAFGELLVCCDHHVVSVVIFFFF